MIGSVISDIIIMSTPILLAGLGGLYTQLGGKLNIGLEGLILLGAFFSGVCGHLSGNLFWGILAGVGVSVLFSLIMILLSDLLKANIFVVGLANNLFCVGFCLWMGELLMGSRGTIYFTQIPALGRDGLGLHWIDYFGIVVAGFSWVILYRTRFGIHLRSVGIDSHTAQSVGISPLMIRIKAYAICGILCGLAGAALSLPIQSFVGGMSGGRGWIALVGVVLSRGNPFGVWWISLIFGAASYLSATLQAMTDFSPKLLLALPFALTLIVGLFISRKPTQEESQ